MKHLLLAFALLAAGAARSEETWNDVPADMIAESLNGRMVRYDDGATQGFGEDGSTLYRGGNVTSGRWKIEGAKYCSTWPPVDKWVCYSLEASPDGQSLRFTGDDGSKTVGHYLSQ